MKILIYNEDLLYLSPLQILLESGLKNAEIKTTSYNKSVNGILNDFSPNILIYICKYPIKKITDQLKAFKERFSSLKLIFVSNTANKKMVKQAKENLVDAYLVQKASPRHLFNAINAVSNQERYVCDEVLNELLNEVNDPFMAKYDLNTREMEVMTLLAQENSTKLIADKLNVSHHTIETNKRQLMKKFNVRTSIGLVKIALREGLAY